MANSDVSPVIQPESSPTQVLTVESPNIAQPPTMANSDVSPIIQPKSSPAQVPTVESPNITAPNTQSPSLIPQTTQYPHFSPNQPPFLNSLFAPNLTQAFSPTLNSNFDTNPQQSLTALMSERMYSWPIQQVDQDLFNFSGLQDSSGMNNFNSGTNCFLPGVDVSLVLRFYRLLLTFVVQHIYPCCTCKRQRFQLQHSCKFQHTVSRL